MSRVVAAALCALSLVLALPAAAQAVPPMCPSPTLTTPPGTPLSLASLTCENAGTNPQVNLVDAPDFGNITGPPFTYTPRAGEWGVDTFKYTVTNTQTAETSATATVTINVNTAPTCTAGSTSTIAGQTVRVAAPCDDADFDLGDRLTMYLDNGNSGVVGFDPSTGEFIYTPAPGFTGMDSFPYFVADALGIESAEGVMTIEVKPAPVVAPPVTSAPQPPPRDLAAPTATLKSSAKPLRQTLSRGLALQLTTNENATAVLTASVDKATARRLKLDRRARGRVTVGKLNAALTPGSSTVTIKLSSKARRAFKSAKQVKLLVTAVITDTAGNKTTKTLAVTLKR